jgi:hypothetical protein
LRRGGRERRPRRERRIFPELRQSEVEDLHAVAREHDVGGLQVAMCDPLPVRVVQRVGNLPGRPKGEWKRHRAAGQPVRQRLARDVLHDQERRRAVLSDVVKSADTGVIDAGDGLRFPLKAFEPVAVGPLAVRSRDDLDGDGALEPRVVGAVHLAHAAGSQGRNDLEGSEANARGKRHQQGAITGH